MFASVSARSCKQLSRARSVALSHRTRYITCGSSAGDSPVAVTSPPSARRILQHRPEPNAEHCQSRVAGKTKTFAESFRGRRPLSAALEYWVSGAGGPRAAYRREFSDRRTVRCAEQSQLSQRCAHRAAGLRPRLTEHRPITTQPRPAHEQHSPAEFTPVGGHKTAHGER